MAYPNEDTPMKERFKEVMESPQSQAGRPMTIDEMVDKIFTYHAPDKEQVLQLQNIREAAKYMAKVIIANTPCGNDRNVAIDHLRGVVMRANAAIVLKGFTPYF